MIFSKLLRKVLAALRLGLPVDKKTLRAVEHMLKKRDRASKVAARALVATLLYTSSNPKAFKHDLSAMELILSQWMRRIMEGEDSFYTKREKEKLVEILKRNNFPEPERFVNKLLVVFSYDTGEIFTDEISRAKRKVERAPRRPSAVREVAEKGRKEEKERHGRKGKVHA